MPLSSRRKTAFVVYGSIALAALIIVFVNFDFDSNSGATAGPSDSSVDREALAQVAPAMSDKAFHRNYESESQCVTCHTQQVMGAPDMPHDPRERCEECHQVET